MIVDQEVSVTLADGSVISGACKGVTDEFGLRLLLENDDEVEVKVGDVALL